MNMVMVPMTESTLARLIVAKGEGERLGDTVTRLLQSREEKTISAQRSEVSVDPSEPLKLARGAVCEQPSKATIRSKQQLVLLGQAYYFRNKIDVWRTFMHELIGLVPDKLDALMAVRFNKRRILAASPAELYSGRSDLKAEPVTRGFWIPINCGGPDIFCNMRAACKAVELEFGKDVSVIFA